MKLLYHFSRIVFGAWFLYSGLAHFLLPGWQPMGSHPSVGQPTGGQPVVPVAPVVPMDQNGIGYAGGRGAAPAGPRHAGQGPTSNSGPQPAIGPVGGGHQLPPPPQQPGQAPSAPPLPGGQQEIGGQSGPIGLVGQGGYSGGPAAQGVSLADAVQSAHEEGQAFGESVARDAPALHTARRAPGRRTRARRGYPRAPPAARLPGRRTLRSIASCCARSSDGRRTG